MQTRARCHTGVLLVVGAVTLGAPAGAGAASPAAVEVYMVQCAKCHGQTGKSDTPDARALKVAPFVGDVRLQAMTAADIANAVRANPKHRAVADVADADVETAAGYVKELVGRPEEQMR
jgi:hypothetical protein